LQVGEREVESAKVSCSWPAPGLRHGHSPLLSAGPKAGFECEDTDMTAQALDPAAENEVLTDLERLQGAWESVAGRREAEFIFSGYLFAVRFKDGDTYLGTFRLDPQQQPRTMDMRIDEGPAHHRGKMARCIYEVADDTLRWCTGEPGAEERPKDFPMENTPKYLSLRLRREPG
jgi:uncharacterized protein (TIGR03067 family)